MVESAHRNFLSLKNDDPLASAGAAVTSWPSLGDLCLAPDAAAERRRRIGGSDANIILSGDRDAVLRLWREKRGEAEPEDLTGVLPVMLGLWSEAFNRLWYQQATGLTVSEVGASVRCGEHSWRTCTLDGYVRRHQAVWEAKHTNAFGNTDEVVQRYMPQLQHNMAVVGARRAVLSVIFGNHRWETFEVNADWLYQEELLIAEARFWDCVKGGVEPVPAIPPPAPRVAGTREVCLQGNNAWAAAAADWLQNREAAKLHATATTSLKRLVEEDVGRAFGHFVEAKRSKSGAITIRELTA